jgi:hypothetical protein
MVGWKKIPLETMGIQTDAVCNDEKLYMNASTILLQNCQPELQEHHYVLNRGFDPS